MQLDHLHAKLGRSIHLLQSRVDKQTDANSGNVQPFNSRFEFLALSDHIQAAFSRYFFTFFRHEADFLWLDAQGDIDDLGCITHLEIQFRHDVLAKAFQIPVLNVAAIAAQMSDDALCTSTFAHARCSQCIGLSVL